MDTAFSIHCDLLFEHQTTIDSSGAPAVQRSIQHRCTIPFGCEAARRLVTDSDAGQGAEFFLHYTSALIDLWLLLDIGGRWLRAPRNSGNVTLRQFESLIRV